MRATRIRRDTASAATVDALLIGICVLEAVTLFYWADVFQILLAFATVAGVSVRRRFPWISVALALPTVALGLATIAPLIAMYSLAVRERRQWRLIAAGIAWMVATVQPWWSFEGIELSFTALRVANGIMFTATPIALGLLVRTRADLSMKLRDLATAKRNERELIYTEMLMEERARIAREMHDVVSHQVSLIAVQAGALQVRSTDLGITQSADTIRGLAVRTLEELRQMVSILKSSEERIDGSEDNGNALLPQPSAADIRELVEASHPDATLRIEIPSLPAVYERTLFRTVQEGLTNARKHAPGARVSVEITTAGDHIVLIIENGRAAHEPLSLPSSGHGLIGLRERANNLGGDVDINQCPDGFRLTLRLPIPRRNRTMRA